MPRPLKAEDLPDPDVFETAPAYVAALADLGIDMNDLSPFTPDERVLIRSQAGIVMKRSVYRFIRSRPDLFPPKPGE